MFQAYSDLLSSLAPEMGEWADTSFGAAKIQDEAGNASLVFQDEDGGWAFAHLVSGELVRGEATLPSRGLAALRADLDFAVL